jgi:hypothetical protein
VQLSEGPDFYDIRLVSQLKRVKPSPWICPFYCPKAAFFGTTVLKVRYGSDIHFVSEMITENLIFGSFSIYRDRLIFGFLLRYPKFSNSEISAFLIQSKKSQN